ncbi:sugar phosphate nucleotidyltransferase [Clostridium disporicum]|uniref:Lic-1 operon protein n=1 Tax=Clostridium disporicum TaxID=84024 RepID=A0A174F146_9CLOT|nr:sugar phosphate nucleotidyltransferase [Clostridium disporicum]CUO43277.1 lic-1 operon protein [Clostridium disporicum]
MRAILLAAGMGTRLRPLTLETPKPLIKVNGESMIERQIEALKDIGVDEIIIVTGYLKEKFDFLKEKYGVKLIHNDKYNVYNNIYTMYLVKDYLRDVYVIEGDIYLNRNFLKANMEQSSYFSAPKYGYKDEWILRMDANDSVIDIEVGSEDGQHIMCGVSYWNDKDGKLIVEKLDECVKNGEFTELFWDDIVKNNISNLNIKVEKIDPNDVYEIDSLQDLDNLNEILSLEK